MLRRSPLGERPIIRKRNIRTANTIEPGKKTKPDHIARLLAVVAIVVALGVMPRGCEDDLPTDSPSNAELLLAKELGQGMASLAISDFHTRGFWGSTYSVDTSYTVEHVQRNADNLGISIDVERYVYGSVHASLLAQSCAIPRGIRQQLTQKIGREAAMMFEVGVMLQWLVVEGCVTDAQKHTRYSDSYEDNYARVKPNLVASVNHRLQVLGLNGDLSFGDDATIETIAESCWAVDEELEKRYASD